MRLTRRAFVRLAAAAPLAALPAVTSRAQNAPRLGGGDHELTILYTNDFHSAFEPVPAFWLPGSPRLGGAAHLATLVERERAAAQTSFLLDSGDMFTGTLSRLTRGEALLEMMMLMRYDAMSVGNHEFDYGWQAFEGGISRVPFPILCCNIRYAASGVRFCRPYTILERNGARIGVIGVIGLRAATRTTMPSMVKGLEFTDPVVEATACLTRLRDTVDVMVVLAHQGLPGPMQSDAENDPEVQRPLDEDLAFCAAVPGVQVYIAAHSHRGLEAPIVHPETGALVAQTFGYGTRLGRIRLAVRDRKIVRHRSELLKVLADDLPPHPGVTSRVGHYRQAFAEQIGPPIGRAAARFTRYYRRESPLGTFVAQILRERAGADIGITNAGGLRADLPEGPVDRAHVLDVAPFLNELMTIELAGGALKRVLEHGFSLEAGMVQVSGLRAVYDLTRPVGARLVRLDVGGKPVDDHARYRVATNSFLAQGGDGYAGFLDGREVARGPAVSEVIVDHIRRAQVVRPPALGALTHV